MTPPRRLAAILAADVAGYSRLMGQDEAGTAQAVRESRDAATPIVVSHGGRVVKTMGDGVLLEFPSVVAAVECAIALQKLMAERNAEVSETRWIIYRIGVHLGDVLIDGDDILGDGVNIAARLEGIAEPGGICLSAAAYEQVRDKLKEEFVDLGEKQLKNIARPMRAYEVKTDSGGGSPAPKASAAEHPEPPRLSIVVLPFANLGGDPEQEYFVDGVTESLTTDLSRIRGSFVIARNTAYSYKGKAIDVKQIGRELNVRYALEGSVQRSGSRMRVNVQLIDAENGGHLWAERFEKPVADLFDMQDEIVSRLANALNAQLVTAEARRADRAPSPDSMDLYFQGMVCVNKGVATGNMVQARGFFERALVLDPGNIEALVGTAIVDVFVAATFVHDDDRALVAKAEATLTSVLSLAPDHAAAHSWLGRLLIGSNRAPQGIAECQQALALDRNLASAHAFVGLGKNAVGRAEESETHVQEALRLSPRDTLAYRWMLIAGSAKLALGADEEAISWLRRSIENNRTNAVAHFSLAAALAHLDHAEEAQSAVRSGLALDPTFTMDRFRAGAASDNPVFLARRERTLAGMRKAGVPEQ